MKSVETLVSTNLKNVAHARLCKYSYESLVAIRDRLSEKLGDPVGGDPRENSTDESAQKVSKATLSPLAESPPEAKLGSATPLRAMRNGDDSKPSNEPVASFLNGANGGNSEDAQNSNKATQEKDCGNGKIRSKRATHHTGDYQCKNRGIDGGEGFKSTFSASDAISEDLSAKLTPSSPLIAPEKQQQEEECTKKKFVIDEILVLKKRVANMRSTPFVSNKWAKFRRLLNYQAAALTFVHTRESDIPYPPEPHEKTTVAFFNAMKLRISKPWSLNSPETRILYNQWISLAAVLALNDVVAVTEIPASKAHERTELLGNLLHMNCEDAETRPWQLITSMPSGIASTGRQKEVHAMYVRSPWKIKNHTSWERVDDLILDYSPLMCLLENEVACNPVCMHDSPEHGYDIFYAYGGHDDCGRSDHDRAMYMYTTTLVI
jgi:hypothetical protein